MRPRRTRRPRAAIAALLVAVAAVGSGMLTACTSDGDDEPPAQLDRIDQPAQVDQNRLGGQPGAVNDDQSGG